MTTDAVLSLNFQFAGSVIDANRLIARGWTDMTGVSRTSEWIRFNSTWVEYTEEYEGKQYRIQCSLSTALSGKSDDDYMLFASCAVGKKSHKPENQRLVYVRRLHAWIFDAAAMSYCDARGNIPETIAKQVRHDLEASLIEPAKDFKKDIAYLTDGLEEKAPERKGNPVDQQFYILSHSADEEFEHNGRESVARLLTQFTHSLLTDDDPDGREYAMGITESLIVDRIVEWAAKTGFHASAVAAMKIAERPHMCDTVQVKTWIRIVESALEINALAEGAEAMRIAFSRFPTLNDIDERNACKAIYWAVVDLGNRCPEDPDGFGMVVEEFAKHVDDYTRWWNDPTPGLWVHIARCKVKKLRGEKVNDDDIGPVYEILKSSLNEYDRSHLKEFEEKPYLKDLPRGVKAPLEWQAFLYTMYGLPELILKSFPEPVSKNEKNLPYMPAAEAAKGLNHADVWSPFTLGKWNEIRDYEWTKCIAKKLKPVYVADNGDCSLISDGNNFESYEILEPEHPEEKEIAGLCVRAKTKSDGKTITLASFPFLPKEFKGNKPNAVVKVWHYRIWEYGEAADAVIEMPDGKMLTAVMPYYVADRRYVLRGIRQKGMLVGFVNALRKIPVPQRHEPITIGKGHLAEENGGPVTLNFDEHFDDYFEQDVLPSEITGAGFSVQGRVKSLRQLTCLGTPLSAVEIDCERLQAPLRVYIATARLKDSLTIGDNVNGYGWLYLDVYGAIDKWKDVKKLYPVASPSFLEKNAYCSGIPKYVRTEFTDEERATLPRSMIEPKWFEYGKLALEHCRGVVQVVMCPPNPLSANYIVKKGNGNVVMYKLIIAKEGEKPCLKYPGLRVFVLRLKPANRGYNLEWEHLPDRNYGKMTAL